MATADSGGCADTCAGCCDPQNNCQPGNTEGQCGSFGEACVNCNLPGEYCFGIPQKLPYVCVASSSQ